MKSNVECERYMKNRKIPDRREMMHKLNRVRNSKRATRFKPSRTDIKLAMDEYLSRGGEITRLIPEKDRPIFERSLGDILETEEFLIED